MTRNARWCNYFHLCNKFCWYIYNLESLQKRLINKKTHRYNCINIFLGDTQMVLNKTGVQCQLLQSRLMQINPLLLVQIIIGANKNCQFTSTPIKIFKYEIIPHQTFFLPKCVFFIYTSAFRLYITTALWFFSCILNCQNLKITLGNNNHLRQLWKVPLWLPTSAVTWSQFYFGQNFQPRQFCWHVNKTASLAVTRGLFSPAGEKLVKTEVGLTVLV